VGQDLFDCCLIQRQSDGVHTRPDIIAL
jgi:hypothetical protein